MNDDHELERSFRALAEESRGELGEPPSSEQLLAFHRGELGAEEAGRIREHLARDPATLDRLLDLIAHVPDPDGIGHLSDEDLAEDWEVIQRRLRVQRPPKAAVVPFPGSRWRWVERSVAVAAVLALTVLGLGLQIRVRELSEKLSAPRLDERSYQVEPDGARGGGTPGEPPTRIPLGKTGVHLTLTLFEAPEFEDYRLEIHAAEPSDGPPRWAHAIQRLPGDAFVITLPPTYPPGDYVFRLYGGEETLLATYSIRLEG